MHRSSEQVREIHDYARRVSLIETLLGLSLLVIAALAGLFLAHHGGLNRIDASGYAHVPGDPGSPLAKNLVKLGSATTLIVGVVIIFLVEVFRDWIRAIMCGVAPIVAVAAVEHVAKPLVGRHIAVGELSYPSGTVTVTAALAASFFLVAPLILRPLCAVLGALALAGVSAGVLVLRWHYPTDVVGGMCVGAGTVFLFDGVARLAWSPSQRALSGGGRAGSQ